MQLWESQHPCWVTFQRGYFWVTSSSVSNPSPVLMSKPSKLIGFPKSKFNKLIGSPWWTLVTKTLSLGLYKEGVNTVQLCPSQVLTTDGKFVAVTMSYVIKKLENLSELGRSE